MADLTGKYLSHSDDGKEKLLDAIATSAGEGDAGKIIKTNTAGDLDVSFLPPGVGPEVVVVTTVENGSAGDFINLHNDGGTIKARKADGSAVKPANGFILEAVTAPAPATVYHLGKENTGLSGLTVGAEYFLSQSSAGDVVLGAALDYTTSGKIIQKLGVAVSATSLLTSMYDYTEIG